MQSRVLIIQTAFYGDVILTLPLVQVLKKKLDAEIDFLCIPKTKVILQNNPYINEVLIFDKRSKDRGIKSFRRIVRKIKFRRYDYVISPHRSLRSTLLSYFSKADLTIGFDTSTLSKLYSKRVNYIKNIHEIQRNLKLLEPLGIEINEIVKPELFIHEEDEKIVNILLKQFDISDNEKFITISPATVWETKRYPERKFIEMLDYLNEDKIPVVLLGGKEDLELCKYIKDKTINKNVFISASKLNILQSAYLIKKSSLLISNDSSPMHLANAVGTKVIAIFGATVPEFGFYPIGKDDIVMQTLGLKCRPCSIHGGDKCPIKTFDCMLNIKAKDIYEKVISMLFQEV